MAKESKSITLGVGDLYINGEDVGYLAGSVTATTEAESQEFRYGTHQSLVKTVVTTVNRSLQASLAQINIESLRLALGIGEEQAGPNFKRLAFGNNWVMRTLKDVKFVHTRDDGEKVVVFFPSAQVAPESTDLEFTSEGFLEQAITIKAVEDLDRPDCPFGFIQVGESEECGALEKVEVDEEAIAEGTADGTGYKYTLAHLPVAKSPAPVITNNDGTVTYEEDKDYTLDYDSGVLTTKGCAETTLTEGTGIKANYSYWKLENA